ncbi:maleylpyruvate isomerase N-terminal domain-containing protein [Amycolatopsis panacis]|uniref:Maleylpyruvate isomerase family mycothiol-dependent enzyme n=1 Tax=Amycolatopsis panacis TaxID=2340917 RepID=A0A419I4D4_9PSEU|nr:maleylpyruvate isomerase N-terminal domain-containing protein [Amycolatopsis panacis]RJQ85239.1 maleylpyruvate isomerase family mycothiol-dependent enzyme [Amycolatopsis panacis]
MDLFPRAWTALQEAVRSLEGGQWVAPSGCTGWLVQDLVAHLIIDAQDVLVTLASTTTTTAPATLTETSYWQPAGEAPDGTDEESAFVRRSAAAYGTTAWLHHHFDDLAVAAVRAAAAADPAARVETRDEVMTVPSYLAMCVLETTLHHLDLIAHLSGMDGPPAETLAASRAMVADIAGFAVAPSLDDRAALLVTTGRRAPSATETAALGEFAAKLPVVLG